jgi:C_GCAxxG_C_C family probable redox protein
MTETELQARARSLFLDDANAFGCAETTLLTLRDALELPGEADPSAVMALNGGVAYSGEICGALSGAAVAAGLAIARAEPDHLAAKRQARAATAELIEDFRQRFGAIRCRELIGLDLSTKERHDAFIASGIWKTVCMGQIEFAVTRLASMLEPEPGQNEESGQEAFHR